MAEKKPENKDNKDKNEVKEEKPVQKMTVLLELRNSLLQLDKALTQNDSRSFLKLTQQLRRFKKAMKPHHFQKVWTTFSLNNIIDFTQNPTFDKEFSENFEIPPKVLQKLGKHQELNIYLHLLLLVFLTNEKTYFKQAYELSGQLLAKAKEINKRYFDNLNALIYFYFARTRELNNEMLEIREELYQAYRTACIRHDEIGQATILNLLLRNYLNFNHYEAAQHLISKSTFPEQKSNNEYCRYLYYTGKIKAVQLEYAESLSRLNQAIRKAPDTTARGFRIEAQKIACVVEMLLGDIPDRDIFAQEDLQTPQLPYYKLVWSVLKGNLLDFTNVVAKYAKFYIHDKLYTLILRLHQMVIKTGLRKINLSYSKISFADISLKLNLPRNTDVEFIVAKGIRDGVLNAKIDHSNQYITIKVQNDMYTTNEPQQAFSKRIAYCLNLYNTATKSLTYPHQNYKIAERDENDGIDPEDLFSLVADSDEF